MKYSARILVLVTVLSTRTGTRVPLYPEVTFVELNQLSFLRVDDGDGNGRGVGATRTFGWWNPLDSMTTSFLVKR